jgi:hypothetical protein
MGMSDVACFCGSDRRCPRGDDDVNFDPGELGDDLGEALGASLRPPILNCNGAPLDPTEFVQAVNKNLDPWFRGRGFRWDEEPNDRYRALLRVRCERPNRCSPNKCHELAPSHMASSKRDDDLEFIAASDSAANANWQDWVSKRLSGPGPVRVNRVTLAVRRSLPVFPD